MMAKNVGNRVEVKLDIALSFVELGVIVVERVSLGALKTSVSACYQKGHTNVLKDILERAEVSIFVQFQTI